MPGSCEFAALEKRYLGRGVLAEPGLSAQPPDAHGRLQKFQTGIIRARSK
jgi:hypothetical protein